MLTILSDNKKFAALGKVEQSDQMLKTERNLQALLLRLKKSNQIDEEFYELTRPTGSERPRIYGLPKIHKQNTPLRPILAMTKSAQHSLAKQLSLLLEPVLLKYSSHVLKDSFTFCEELNRYHFDSDNLMCSFGVLLITARDCPGTARDCPGTACDCPRLPFDIVNLFTNIPLDETMEICINSLYHSEITPPSISQEAFRELMIFATKAVEFSFGDEIFKQVDGVAMSSPLGPALANIFVGYNEAKLFNGSQVLPKWYKRFVDDTFCIR